MEWFPSTLLTLLLVVVSFFIIRGAYHSFMPTIDEANFNKGKYVFWEQVGIILLVLIYLTVVIYVIYFSLSGYIESSIDY